MVTTGRDGADTTRIVETWKEYKLVHEVVGVLFARREGGVAEAYFKLLHWGYKD